MSTLAPLETLYEMGQGNALPLPPELASVYGRLAFPPHPGRPYVIGNFAGLENTQARINVCAGRDDNVERRAGLPQGDPKFLIHAGERWADVGGGPDVVRHRPQRPGADDHGVGRRPQQPHHQMIMRVEPADRAAPGLPGHLE